jgi:hypothetical protein
MTCTQTTLPSLLQSPHWDDIQESSIYHINTAYVSQEVIFVPVEQIMQPDMFRQLLLEINIVSSYVSTNINICIALPNLGRDSVGLQAFLVQIS